MSERNTLGSPQPENPVDIIKRTVNDRMVIIFSFLDGNALKFQAQVGGGPIIILQQEDGNWVGNHPNGELVAQLGEIIESASD